MKLSVATYRASTERLASLRQNTYGTTSDHRRGSSLDSGAARFLQARKPSRSAITSVSLPKKPDSPEAKHLRMRSTDSRDTWVA
ncbi:hypothetical protein HPB47_017993 [Ixodes persulcatus]|uniref:Uncharacterized protein n=2 Tax=Ixodes persulcatus TaxID=34615 RepID=A0AC60QLU3_IXOPE|nr:hypothetical protein HPB47_022290 [Ixodes persulcatus]KAG0436349.1 hypothetical protein HPB47_017993 [Ixodes persulcatus]